MKVRSVLTAALIVALTAPLAARAADPPAPTVERATGGGIIVRQPDPSSTLVGVAIVVSAGLDRQTMKQNGLAALVAETILRTPVTLPSKSSSVQMPLEQAIADALSARPIDSLRRRS